MQKSFWLDPRDKPALLVAIMRALAGGAYIGFEGDLADCDFSGIPGLVCNQAGAITRTGIPPAPDIVVIPLEQNTIGPILKQVLPHGRVVRKLDFIQIEKYGALQFLAGDNFHRECVSVGPAVPEILLQSLLARGILRGYKHA